MITLSNKISANEKQNKHKITLARITKGKRELIVFIFSLGS